MFALFYSLYLAMFKGVWVSYTLNDALGILKNGLNAIGTFLTSIFGDFQVTNFGDGIYYIYPEMISIILATVTSIGIVVMAVKGVKKAFGIFFGYIR